MQIVDVSTGEVVQWEPGRSVEVDLVEDCLARILKRGVGFFRTSTHVEDDIRAGLLEALLELKKKVRAPKTRN